MKKQIKKDLLVENIGSWGFIIGLIILASIAGLVLINAIKEIL